jgi:hypothetical protein
MHGVMAASTPHLPLVALGAAYVKLMRIIPDNQLGYSDSLVTVKHYLLAGYASAFDAVAPGFAFPLSP